MLCDKCYKRFGISYSYLLKMVRVFKPENKSGVVVKQEIIDILESRDDKICELKEKIELLDKRIKTLETIK